jgi:hypothetical protein
MLAGGKERPMHPRQRAIRNLQFSRQVVTKLVEGWPAEKWTHQPTPGANHALWTLGHIALTDAWIGGVVGAGDVRTPEGFDQHFGYGSVPKPDPAGYPEPAEVRAAFERTRGALLAWAEGASDEALERSLKEQTHGFAYDALDGLLKLAWHEGWHAGQIATIRKSLGMPGVL